MDFASFKPCYKQKFFWVDDNLVAFEFGEDRAGSIHADKVSISIRARYVWYQTNLQGVRTGTSACIVTQSINKEEGQRLFDLADEAGAAQWWQEWKRREQMIDPYGLTKIGQNIKRRVMNVKWHLRRWWRKRNKGY